MGEVVTLNTKAASALESARAELEPAEHESLRSELVLFPGLDFRKMRQILDYLWETETK
jgi:hypothetical protein